MNVSDIKVEWPVKSCKIIVTVIESSNVSLRNEKKKKRKRLPLVVVQTKSEPKLELSSSLPVHLILVCGYWPICYLL